MSEIYTPFEDINRPAPTTTRDMSSPIDALNAIKRLPMTLGAWYDMQKLANDALAKLAPAPVTEPAGETATPRTDAFMRLPHPTEGIPMLQWRDFARTLERELASVTAERDKARGVAAGWMNRAVVAESTLAAARAKIAELEATVDRLTTTIQNNPNT